MATCESTVYLVFVDVSKSSQLKFVSDCPGQVDFPFCQVTLLVHLSDGYVCWKIINCKILRISVSI